jgi:probable F420-dependent oxidoreductase
MQFGLRLPSFALGERTASLAEMGGYLRRAEDLGFDTAMLIDHLLVAGPAYRVAWLEPVSLLSALAGVTRTIRLGTLVLVLPFRDPVALAKEWATLDVLSGGRSILGVGVGWNEAEFEALRIPYRERGRRTTEMLEAITALWAGDHVTYEGRHYQFRDLTIEPKPVQKPHPPIWIGGDGEAAFRRVGRLGDAWHAAFNRPEQLADKYARVQAHASEAGRDPRSVGLTVRTSAPTDMPQAIERLKAYAEAGVSHVALELWANSMDDFRAVVERYAREVRPALQRTREVRYPRGPLAFAWLDPVALVPQTMCLCFHAAGELLV